jgi:hypothetical protein
LIYGFGYVKDADLHSPASGRVAPLPFRDMGAFPPEPEAYLADQVRARTDTEYNTRVILPSDPLRRWPSGSAVDLP